MIWSYKLAELEESTRSDLKAKVKTVMASPQKTEILRRIREANPDLSEVYVLRCIKLDSLFVLGMLGECEVIPSLIRQLKAKEGPKDARINIAIAAVLRYLTGQDIGGYILSDEDIAAWEEWWGQNQSAIVNGS